YDAAINRINDQDEDDRTVARSTLTWVANSKRLLTVPELREALAIEPGATRLDPDNLLDIGIILSVCAGLVIVEGNTGFVRLVHYTAQCYLDTIQALQFPNAQTEITCRLLTYMRF
ncbi:hypothetical protein DFH09DRAFT_820362, partial [Mycena vulgaris]